LVVTALVGAPLLTTPAFAARPTAPDSMAKGAYAFESAEYKLPAAIDPEVLPGTATEIWARVFWPRDLRGSHPILFFLHGNHPTCGTGTNPRQDWDCQYTFDGTCPAGQAVVPNHEGYNYLAEHFASHGFIVVTINANRGITCNNGDDTDSGLNLARGRLVLRHLELWKNWSSVGGVPASLGVPDRAFIGHVDFARVGLMGHSRGGEGMRAALALYRDNGSPWPARVPGLDVKAIYEIGAVDGQTPRTLDADDVAWNQLLPMCDGDVADLQGRLPFERMILKDKEARRTPKSLTMAWGTNHNFFNSEWQENDSWGCVGHEPIYGTGWESETQRNVALVSMGAFFRAHLNGETALAYQFDPRFLVPNSLSSMTRIDRDHIYTPDLAFSARVDDFDQPTGVSSARVANEAMGVNTTNDVIHMPQRARVSWTKRGGYFQVNWSGDGSGHDVSRFTYLDFRVARQESQSPGDSATDFSVQLVDASGKLSGKVAVSQFAEVLGPANATIVFQTVRIPINAFAPFPSASIRGVRFNFDISPQGALSFANVRFSSLPNVSPAAFSHLTPIDATAVQASYGPAPRPPEQHARIVDVRTRRSSHYFGARPSAGPSMKTQNSVEIVIRADGRFPVLDAQPVLVIDGKQFTFSRHAEPGRTHSLVFALPLADIQALPEQAAMHIQYGSGAPTRIWRLPAFARRDWIK
jgi:hypothetical protein